LGVKNEKQMEENTEALGWQLDSKHKEEIDHIFAVN